MEAQANNLENELIKVLSTNDVRLAFFNVSINFMGMSVHQETDMSLTYLVNQMHMDPSVALTELESKNSAFFKKAKAHFVGRNVERDFMGNMVVNYRIKMSDYSLFLEVAAKEYRGVMDAEFTAALEVTISED